MTALVDLAVAGSSPHTTSVARALDLPVVDGPTTVPLVIVASTEGDVDAVRAALGRAETRVAAIVAVDLAEDQVVAAYDLGVAVAFGLCARSDLDAAIAAAPDADARSLAATLASIEQAIGAQP